MTVADIRTDPANRTLTVVAELDATVARAWELWADPRQLERWWGPPGFPATFERHELVAGGVATYVMNGPDGQQPRGWWRVRSVDPPHSLEIDDGFGDVDAPDEHLPVLLMRVRLEPIEGTAESGRARTRMTITSTFASDEAMQQVLEMGMAEGMSAAIGQIDAVLV
jgi:uncharacterized protein YndB with AHSA1/START domain